MGFWSKFKSGFLSGKTKTETRERTVLVYSSNAEKGDDSINPLTDPIDNPFDVRKDGSIRPGDPMWDIMMRSINTGRAMHGTQREDGSWDVKEEDDGDWKSL